jgi:hypothetical protein
MSGRMPSDANITVRSALPIAFSLGGGAAK